MVTLYCTMVLQQFPKTIIKILQTNKKLFNNYRCLYKLNLAICVKRVQSDELLLERDRSPHSPSLCTGNSRNKQWHFKHMIHPRFVLPLLLKIKHTIKLLITHLTAFSKNVRVVINSHSCLQSIRVLCKSTVFNPFLLNQDITFHSRDKNMHLICYPIP